ncbi:MAG TPA: aldehyde dehydrogenase family protein [Acidimicrobiia bacterium]|nr:aldehyde dehydrogenase family protein [Acidimicrobiia bacterium]
MQSQALTPTTELSEIPNLVASLRRTYENGRTRPIEWRREQLQHLKALLEEREADLLDALAADLGKPRLEGWATDIGIVINEIEHALRHLAGWMKPERVWTPIAQRPARAAIHREPKGVVLVIAPWNYPVHLLLLPMVGALAAGNCVVGKPSEVTAHTSATLARLEPEYLDRESIAIVEGGVPETQALLAERFDHIFYTGNGRVGRVVMEAAAKHLTPVTLELGGKSPAIVDRDANLDVAARRIAFGKFLNAGQTCIAPDYVLVTREQEQPLIERIGQVICEFYSPDPAQSPDYARIVNDAHFQRLEKLLGSGAPAVGGDSRASERYIAPTVLRDVGADSPVMSDEIFGPILPVLSVADIDEAIRFVNDRDCPLALYLFSESHAVQQRILAETTSDGACVNTNVMHVAVPELPFGGVGPSGMGAYHGKASFDVFSHRKSVLTRPARPDPKIAYPPYTRLKERIIRRFF